MKPQARQLVLRAVDVYLAELDRIDEQFPEIKRTREEPWPFRESGGRHIARKSLQGKAETELFRRLEDVRKEES